MASSIINLFIFLLIKIKFSKNKKTFRILMKLIIYATTKGLYIKISIKLKTYLTNSTA